VVLVKSLRYSGTLGKLGPFRVSSFLIQDFTNTLQLDLKSMIPCIDVTYQSYKHLVAPLQVSYPLATRKAMNALTCSRIPRRIPNRVLHAATLLDGSRTDIKEYIDMLHDFSSPSHGSCETSLLFRVGKR